MKTASGLTSQGTKAMKVMKSKRVSNIARGRFAKALVLMGKKMKTASGLTSGRCRYAQIESWVEAHMKARQALNIEGFVPINGQTIQGKAIYVKAKAIKAAGSGMANFSS